MEFVKKCKKHGDLIESQIRRRRDKKEIVCKLCESERHKRYIKENPEKTKIRRKNFRYIERPKCTKELLCCRCKETKSVGEFNSHMFNIRYPYCLECRRNATKSYRQKDESKLKHREYYKTKYEQTAENNRLKKLYGITLDYYDELLQSQDFVCAICKKQETQKTTSKRISRLSVDHNHSTGSIRGLLCYACNTGIGQFKENKEIMINAIRYLEKYE